jgi:hypothetical protein
VSEHSYHPALIYPKSGGIKRGARVPQSCIESCETILRMYRNGDYSFVHGGQGSGPGAPAMFLQLSRSDCVLGLNVSDLDADRVFRECQGMSSMFPEDAKLAEVLKLGQGISFINVGVGDKDGYNMHFLAVLKIEGETVTLSDVSEPDDWNQTSTVKITTITAKTVGGLRTALGEPYTDTTNYAAGLVWMGS